MRTVSADPSEIFAKVVSICETWDGVLDDICNAEGLRRSDADVLLVLNGSDGISPGSLARRVGLTSGGITARIDRLERDGLIRRFPDPDDRRGLRVQLTSAGQVMAGSLTEGIRRAQLRALSWLPNRRLHDLGELLHNMERFLVASGPYKDRDSAQ